MKTDRGLYRGRFDEKSLTGTYRTSLFGSRLDFLILSRADIQPFGRKRVIYLDDSSGCSYLPGSHVVVDAGNVAQRVEHAAQNKLWKHIGGHDLSTMEMLIYLGAGYGFFRWLEYFITTVFHQ